MEENNGSILELKIVDEIKQSFLEYSMSVIVARALPDVRDGLKPVHRRILYSMNELGITAASQHKKSARIVGDVLGKYHPHGDASVYDALARMAQDFNLRYMLVDGHGHFGSIDGDPVAAMRYTEARLSKIAMEMLADIGKNVVDFIPNFDETLKEPAVLPAAIPNLLINGSQGIAVGMATNIPPHNLGEVIDASVALLDNKDISIKDLIKIIKAPDFPTGAIITGNSEIEQLYSTGRGKIYTRAKCTIEEKANGQSSIIVTEIPYMVNKANMIKNIADHVNDKKIEGISDINDHSDMEGLRIVIDIKRGYDPNVVLNKLYKLTELQSTFGANMLALVNGEPKTLNIKEMLYYYLLHRKEVLVRRCKFELEKAEARKHIVEGLIKALDIIDEIIATIRSSANTAEARTSLVEKYGFTEIQATEILNMRLQALTGLERIKLDEELASLIATIADLKETIANEDKQDSIIKADLTEIKRKYNDPRRTQVDVSATDIDIDDLVEEKNVVISLTQRGYVKRIPIDQYRLQNRGGRGVKGVAARDGDYIREIVAATTHQRILLFTSFGRVHSLTGYDIPEASKTALGSALINKLALQPNERVQQILALDKNTDNKYIVFSTKKGYVKRMMLSEIANIRKNGLNTIVLEEDDELVSVKVTSGNDDVLVATHMGKAIRFPESDLRPSGRIARGSRGIKVAEDDRVIDMDIITEDNCDIFCISENGFGKRTEASMYSNQNRGGKGVKTMNITDKTGPIASMKVVYDDKDMLIMNSSGIIIRTPIDQISTTGRNTQGVKIMRLDEDEKVVSIAIVEHLKEEDAISAEQADTQAAASDTPVEQADETVVE
ncbi:MAG: DNA gyrase subunit A [Clostridiales bacterium]|nr:DNA gyrase subunit A [Clostridiales bacterium]